MILFITNKEDITTDILINKLNKNEVPYYRFNTEDIFNKTEIFFNFDKEKSYIYDKEKSLNINLNNITSVYFRRPKLPEIPDSLDICESERKYLDKESFYLLRGIYDLLEDKYWINNYWSIIRAESKIFQLQIAKKLGLKIPESVITNNVQAAKKFIQEKECIIKPIKSGAVNDKKEPKVIFTNIFSKDYTKVDRVKNFPTFFQKHIKKLADIRVTVVGKEFFAAKIYSQEINSTKVDWRAKDSIKLRYEQIELPQIIKNRCKELMKYFNLQFAAMDFILEPNGEFTFLEINPNGQWGWIENRLKVPISDSIINLLLGKNENL